MKMKYKQYYNIIETLFVVSLKIPAKCYWRFGSVDYAKGNKESKQILIFGQLVNNKSVKIYMTEECEQGRMKCLHI